MTRNHRHRYTPLVLTLIAALLIVFPADTFAQSRARFAAKTQKDWTKAVSGVCPGGANAPTTVTAACAHAAIVQTDRACAESGKFYSKGSTAWQWISFALIASSAASTAVGASATVANAKIWSTLGGTTGLGAVTTSANGNVTSDQSGLAAVAAAQANFNTFVDSEYSKPSPNYERIYAEAPGYASACALAATTTTPAKQPSTPSITTTALPNGKVGTVYGPQSLAVAAGTAPYTWALTSGTLPAGLTFAAGVISGTPTAAVNATPLTFKVTDSGAPPQTATVNLTLTITN